LRNSPTAIRAFAKASRRNCLPCVLAPIRTRSLGTPRWVLAVLGFRALQKKRKMTDLDGARFARHSARLRTSQPFIIGNQRAMPIRSAVAGRTTGRARIPWNMPGARSPNGDVKGKNSPRRCALPMNVNGSKRWFSRSRTARPEVRPERDGRPFADSELPPVRSRRFGSVPQTPLDTKGISSARAPVLEFETG
jgi:hypothetical protein